MSTWSNNKQAIESFMIGDGLIGISLAGRGLLLIMLIILEPHDISGSNFAYLFILTLTSRWYAKHCIDTRTQNVVGSLKISIIWNIHIN